MPRPGKKNPRGKRESNPGPPLSRRTPYHKAVEAAHRGGHAVCPVMPNLVILYNGISPQCRKPVATLTVPALINAIPLISFSMSVCSGVQNKLAGWGTTGRVARCLGCEERECICVWTGLFEGQTPLFLPPSVDGDLVFGSWLALSVCLSVCLSVSLCVCMSVCMSVSLSLSVSVCLSV